jgi:hypothetical protein
MSDPGLRGVFGTSRGTMGGTVAPCGCARAGSLCRSRFILLLVVTLWSVFAVDAQTGPFWRFLAGKCFGSDERCGWRNLGYVMRSENDSGECTRFGCAYAPVFEFTWFCGQGDCDPELGGPPS